MTGANKGALHTGPVFLVAVNRRGRRVQFTLDAARQLTFGVYDGSAKVEPAAYDLVGDENAPELPTAEELESAGQLRLFLLGGTSSPGDDWTDQYSLALEGIGTAYGRGTKRGRSMVRRSISARACGMFVERRVCACGTCATARRVVDCNTRACIRGCAKVNADATRMALERTMLELKAAKHVHRRANGMVLPYTAYLLTVTIQSNPLDPADLHPDAIAERERATTRAMRRIGNEVLKRDEHGLVRRAFGMHWRTEVSHGGNVHKHAAVWCTYLELEVLEHMRRIVREESPNGKGNIDWKRMMRKRRKDGTYTDPLREAAKYVTKGSSPKRSVGKFARSFPSTRMHPVLAALVEAAFFGVQLEGGMGTLRKIAGDAEELEATAEELEIPKPACMKPTEDGDCGECGPCLDKNRQHCTTCGVLPYFAGFVPIYEVREIHGVCKAKPLSPQERKDARYLARSDNASDSEAMRERFTRHAVQGRGPPGG